MNKRGALGLASYLAVVAACTSPQPSAKADEANGDSAHNQPVQSTTGSKTAPPEPSRNVTVISVPAVVTVVEARYVGNGGGSIVQAEATVPLAAEGGGSAGAGEIELARALLGWQAPAPLPAGLESLDPAATGGDSKLLIEEGMLTFTDESETEKSIPLSDLVPGGLAPRSGYDAESGRLLVVALSDVEGRPSLPVTMVVGPATTMGGVWTSVGFGTSGSSGASSPSEATLELVASGRNALYCLTESGAVDSTHTARRSVWIISKTVYDGSSPAVTRVDG